MLDFWCHSPKVYPTILMPHVVHSDDVDLCRSPKGRPSAMALSSGTMVGSDAHVHFVFVLFCSPVLRDNSIRLSVTLLRKKWESRRCFSALRQDQLNSERLPFPRGTVLFLPHRFSLFPDFSTRTLCPIPPGCRIANGCLSRGLLPDLDGYTID